MRPRKGTSIYKRSIGMREGAEERRRRRRRRFRAGGNKGPIRAIETNLDPLYNSGEREEGRKDSNGIGKVD